MCESECYITPFRSDGKGWQQQGRGGKGGGGMGGVGREGRVWKEGERGG